MYKIKMVLADYDSQYVDKVVEYISQTYESKIKIVSFTEVNSLSRYLEKNQEKYDILLADSDFFAKDILDNEKVLLKAVLHDGSLDIKNDIFPVVAKYQSGDQLVSQLFELISEKSENISNIIAGKREAKLVTIFSPAGGAGKTSISLGLANKLGDLGKKVFYLNMEFINSMMATQSDSENQGLSHILISLAENPQSLSVKLEKYKNGDPIGKFDFFAPPQCCLELSELGVDQLHKLLLILKQTGNYDVILIDTHGIFDDKMVAMLKVSDHVVLVQSQDTISQYKAETFLEEMRVTGLAEKIGLPKKLVTVINKCSDGVGYEKRQIGEKEVFTLPFYSNLWIRENGRCIFDNTRAFINDLKQLAQFLTDPKEGGGNLL